MGDFARGTLVAQGYGVAIGALGFVAAGTAQGMPVWFVAGMATAASLATAGATLLWANRHNTIAVYVR